MRLVERYALSTGLKIGKQFLLESFFPLPFTKYITLQASSSQNAAKNYPYYAEVVSLIKPYLATQKIEIVQMGGKEDVPIPNCYHTMGKDSLGQGSHILRSSLLHIGNDSIWGHRAGYLKIPLLQPWGPTAPQCHSSFEHDPSITVFLESHRWGKNPSFVQQEYPLSIGLIDPYEMARKALDLLKISHSIDQRTVFVGQVYNATMFDYIPNLPVSPQFNADIPLNARMDIDFNEQVLANTLMTGRKINLVTKKPMNLNLLATFKGQILSYNHEIDESVDLGYVRAVKKILQNVTFFTRNKDEKALADLRFKFFDVVNIQLVSSKTKEDFERESAEYQNLDGQTAKNELDSFLKSGNLKFKSNKFVLSNGKMYLSLAHAAADIPMVGENREAQVLDDPEFWRDIAHFMVLT